MATLDDEIPPERKRQFDLIEAASNSMLTWAQAERLPLVRIEPVVPFVETDFSLYAWLFLDTEATVRLFRSDGTADSLASRFRSELSGVGYPSAWLALVTCDFASKEVVDRDYEGNFLYFLR